MKKKTIILIAVLSLAVLSVNCGDFLSGGILDNDPNRTTEVPTLSQLVALQPIGYGFYLCDIGVYVSVWMQHMAGVAHQYETYEVYQMQNIDFASFGQMYQEGGLIDIKVLKAKAEEEEAQTVLGLAKLYEALIFASGADVWGAIPYSEACREDVLHPHYDAQSSVHNAVLALLDDAISDLQAAESASDYFDGSFDFSFVGDRDKMIAAAHSLKARILLNWAEVNNGNYQLALTEAQQGISSLAGTWQAPFFDVVDQQNVYYQFNSIRGQNIKAGAYFVELMRDDNDPRLEFYFGEDQTGNDTITGSAHGEYNADASWLNPNTFGDPAWDLDIFSYEENQFIIAECQYNLGQEGAALTTLNNVLGKIEERWGFDTESIQRYSDISGADLLEAIMLEKYKALFLNPQVWNDWKRTGFPQIVSNAVNKDIPRRFMYPDDEENSNENFPGVRGMWERNENDPGNPSY